MGKQQKQKALSPKEYIRTKARQLPLGDCWVNADWKEAELALVIVTRRHPQNTYTVGTYLVDTLCLGVTDSDWHFSIDRLDYEDLLKSYPGFGKFDKITYEEAHNIIYGAVAFAEEGGVDPADSFYFTEYILEEDTEDIPLIEYKFGRDGKHYLMAKDRIEFSKYAPKLRTALGDDFLFSLPGMTEPKPGSEYRDLSMVDAFADSFRETLGWQRIPEEEYSFVNGELPKLLSLHHGWLETLLYAPENRMFLSDDALNRVFALPHEELRADLEQILLYETGRTCGELTDEQFDEVAARSVQIHCLLLLGELGNPASLPVVLVALCQNEEFCECHFGDLMSEVFVPTLYLLGKDRLDELMNYMQTPGLYTFARIRVSETMVMLALRHPERRDEVIGWFRTLFAFYDGRLEKRECCDGALIGMMAADLQDIHAVELLPELKKLYDTGLVDEGCCGDFKQVEEEMATGEVLADNFPTDIHERYAQLKPWR